MSERTFILDTRLGTATEYRLSSSKHFPNQLEVYLVSDLGTARANWHFIAKTELSDWEYEELLSLFLANNLTEIA